MTFRAITAALRRMAGEGALPVDCDVDRLVPSTEISELGIDSLGALILIAELEAAIGIRIPDGTLAGVRTLGELDSRLIRLRQDEP